MKRCATMPGSGEFSLCGDAFDAPDDYACETEPFEMATPGQKVTCEACQGILYELRRDYTPKYTMKRHW